MTKQNDKSFIERWNAKEHQLGFAGLGGSFIECGDSILPSAAAPCLSFADAESMPAIWDAFDPGGSWSATDKQRLEPYRLIGSDGAGNPICLESATGEIRLLDHEDHFRTSQFVNSGISQLAECLLAYMGENVADNFKSAVNLVDPSALRNGSFWYHEAACIGDID